MSFLNGLHQKQFPSSEGRVLLPTPAIESGTQNGKANGTAPAWKTDRTKPDSSQGGETLAIARVDSPLLTAIDALVVAPEKKAEVYQKMAAKVRDIRQRFDKKRLTSSLMDLLDEEHYKVTDK